MIKKIAVLSDIHGNFDALREVLKDIDQFGDVPILNLGDSAYGPLMPEETVQLIVERKMVSVYGNEDRQIIEAITSKAHNRTIEKNKNALSVSSLEWLKQLPKTREYDGMLLCHGTPHNDQEYLSEKITSSGMQLRSSQELMEILEGIENQITLCGHSHLPQFVSLPNGKIIINPGSVGLQAYTDDNPVNHFVETGNPWASYCMLTLDNNNLVNVEHRRIPYELENAIMLARTNNRLDWQKWLATGRAIS